MFSFQFAPCQTKPALCQGQLWDQSVSAAVAGLQSRLLRRFFLLAAVPWWSLVLALPAQAIGFAEALQRAAQQPSHQADADAVAQRQKGDSHLPGRWGNPELQLGVGPGFASAGFAEPGTELMVMAQQPWQLQDGAKARKQAAAAERQALQAVAERRLLERSLQTAEAWLSLHTAEQLLLAAQEEATAAADLAQALVQAGKRGAVTSGDVAEAVVAAAQYKAQVLAAEGVAWHAASQLASQVGLPVAPTSHTALPAATSGPAPSPVLPEPAQWPRWLAQTESLPLVREQSLLAQAAKLRVTELRAGAGSQLVVGAQAQRNAADEWQFYGLIGLRWARHDQAQRAVSAAQAEASHAKGAAEETSRSARLVLQLALHEVAHTRESEALLSEEALPAAERLLALRLEAQKRGSGTVLDVLRARQHRLQSRANLLVAQGERRRAELAAWLLLSAIQGEGGRR